MAINFFACSNGLGHTKRCVDLARKFEESGHQVRVFVGEEKKNSSALLSDISSNKTIYLDDTFLLFDFDETIFQSSINSRIEDDDINIVDTHLELAARLSRKLLLANFLWHDVITCQASFCRAQQLFFKEFKNPIIGHHFFAMPKIQERENFHGYQFTLQNWQTKSGIKGLLVSSGASNRGIDEFRARRDFINEMARNFDIIYLDRYLMADIELQHNNVKLAKFDDDMFKTINYALIRPGLGTLKELITRQINFDCVYEEGNKEMEHNHNVAVSKGFSKPYEAPRSHMSKSDTDLSKNGEIFDVVKQCIKLV